ncbi:hornerin isoform X2 [Cephus cinctus]|uniref:Hornerin isoform X2 n=1 Tax=Cephus cinctus TaxID=211228 RepID=A0AAJ7FVL6_CEPCN|nr:hornerin isoform X2 [Cephus cinctus]
MKKIIIFCALVVPSLSAPSGCTESCRTYSNYNSQEHTADLENLAQQATVALDSSPLNFDSSRPGNWSEQDQYKTDGGHGQVYQEHGQYVQGPKRVRFFKKNYTSSYSTGRLGGLESMNLGIANNNGGYDASQLSQTTAERFSHLFDQSSNLEANNYGSAQPILHGHQSSRRVGSQSERLEDFGELSGSTQVSQHGISGFDSQTAQGQDIQSTYGHSQLDASLPGNWSKADSYRTDGGNGRVYEEQGQVVTGPRRIRYYRKNYTSSYTNAGMPNINLGTINLDRDIQQFGKQYDSFGREIHQVSSSNIHSDNQDLQSTGTTYGNNEYRTGSVRVANNDLINSNSQGLSQGTLDIGAPSTNYGQRTSGTRYPQVSTTRDEAATSNSDGNSYVSNQQGSRRIYWQATPRPVTTIGQSGHQQVASSESYTSGTQQSYQNSYGSEDHQISQTANRGGQVHDRVPIGSSRGQYGATSQDILQSQVDQAQQSQVSDSQQSGYAQGQVSTANHDQGGYIQNFGQSSGTRPGQIRHYQEYSSSSSHRTGGYVPDIGTGNLQVDDSQQTQQVTQQHSGRIESSNQQTSYDILHGHNTNGNEGLTQQNEDLTQQATSGIVFGQQTQQTSEPDQFQVGNQHVEDLTQQSEDFVQQISKIELGPQQSTKPGKLQVENQQVGDLIPPDEDLTQQTGGFEDFTQQTSGKIELGQQKSSIPGQLEVENQETHDLTQHADGFDDFTQQTSGKIELGQQQSSIPGQLEIENQETHDLTQQTDGFDDFTQQTSGKIEFGQQTQQSRKPGKLQVENEDVDDLTQQTAGLDDFTQQTSGKIEFGQQFELNKFQGANQETEKVHEQTDGFDDFTQQIPGKVEYGQLETQSSSWRPGPLQVGNQEVENLTQQTGDIDDFIQQTSGKVEMDQQSQSSRKPGNFNADGQSNDDLVQQTGGFGDLMQQTSGNFEFGQETQDSWNVGQPQIGNQQAEDLTQQNEDLTQTTSGFEDFIQSPSESFGNTQKTEQFGLNQQVNEQLPAPKPKLKRKHPKPSQINYVQQGELHQETTGVLQSQQKNDQLNHAQQSNVEWESSDSVQQIAKETVHGQENVNNDNVTPLEVDLEVDDNIRTGNVIRRGDQSQVYYRESAKKPSEVEKPQSNSNVPQQGTVTIQQTGHRPDFTIEHYNGYGERQSGSEWHDTHNVADLTNSEGVRSHPHQSSYVPSTASSSNGQTNYVQSSQSQQSLDNQQQFPESNIGPDFGQQQNTEDFQQQSSQLNFDQNSEDQKDFNDFQQQTSHISFDSRPQYPQYSSDLPQQSSQLNFNKNFDDHKDVDDFQQQSSQSIYESGAHQQNSKNLENQITPVSINNVSQNKLNSEQLHQQYSQNNFGQQAPEILDLTQQSNNNFQTFEKDEQKVGFQQHADNIELDHQQFQYGQEDTDNLQQQSSRFETERDIDQTSQIEQQSTMQKGEDVNIEPRLLEAYGGGSFDSVPSRDIYNNARRNPSATLTPYTSGADPWVIWEKPKVMTTVTTTTEEITTTAPETTTNVPFTTETAVTTEASIWRRFGNKLTNTYDKFRGSARVLFG